MRSRGRTNSARDVLPHIQSAAKLIISGAVSRRKGKRIERLDKQSNNPRNKSKRKADGQHLPSAVQLKGKEGPAKSPPLCDAGRRETWGHASGHESKSHPALLFPSSAFVERSAWAIHSTRIPYPRPIILPRLHLRIYASCFNVDDYDVSFFFSFSPTRQ